MQVNPQTHQLKLCDFGSAKVLVSSLVFNFFPCNIIMFIRYKIPLGPKLQCVFLCY